MQTFKTIDLAPTWREILPALLALLEEPATRQDALDELAKMAGAADYLASLARAGRINPAPRKEA